MSPSFHSIYDNLLILYSHFFSFLFFLPSSLSWPLSLSVSSGWRRWSRKMKGKKRLEASWLESWGLRRLNTWPPPGRQTELKLPWNIVMNWDIFPVSVPSARNLSWSRLFIRPGRLDQIFLIINFLLQAVRGGDDGVQQDPGGVPGAEQEQDQEAAGDRREAGNGRGAGADAGGESRIRVETFEILRSDWLRSWCC